MTDFAPASEFPSAREADWDARVRRILGDDRDAASLRTETRDGLSILPVYPQRHPGHALASAPRRWRVFQRVDHPDPAVANELALRELEDGVDGLEIVLPGSRAARGHGVGINSLQDLDRLLADIDLETVALRIDAGYEARQAIALMAALLERRGPDPAMVRAVALSDPLSALLVDGRLVAPYETGCDWSAELLKGLRGRGFRMPVYVAEGRSVHAVGGTEAQELAYAIGSAVSHLRALEARGLAPEEAAANVTFALAADSDQFLTMAKLRACRLLWRHVQRHAGLPETPPHLHAETAWRMMARYDPWTNILRSAIAVSAAGAGGADSVTVLPFTLARGLPDRFARRVARNTHRVLLEEAALADVADPCAGSGYVEALTEGLCETAWKLFQEMERAGGLVEVLYKGRFQEQVVAARRDLEAQAARRHLPVIGVSEYANLAEPSAHVMEADPPQLVRSGDPLTWPPSGNGRFEALVAAITEGASMADINATLGGEWRRSSNTSWYRLAEPFENLRAVCDAIEASGSRRPGVFLANLGSLAKYSAIAAWAENVYAAGGLTAIHGTGGRDVAAVVEEFGDSGRRIACVCGPAELLSELASDLVRGLKAAGAWRVALVADVDRAVERGWQEADVILGEGCDILSELKTVHARLGLAETRPAEMETRQG